MRHLRLSIIALLLDLTFFFNIERLTFDEDRTHFIDLQSFIYPLGIIAVLATLLVPILRRAPVGVSFALWIIVYFVNKLLIFTYRPLIGPINTYLSMTEIGLLCLSIWLAHNVGRDLDEFTQAVENITFENRKVPNLDEVAREVEKEFIRSRRHHRPLSVVVVEPDLVSVETKLHRMIQEVQQSMMVRYVITSLGHSLINELRRIDLVVRQAESNRFIVICPETDADNTTAVLNRIYNAASNFGVTVTCGTAAFPNDALTFEELVSRAESHRQPLIKEGAVLKVHAD
jgi:hypothetical protein